MRSKKILTATLAALLAANSAIVCAYAVEETETPVTQAVGDVTITSAEAGSNPDATEFATSFPYTVSYTGGKVVVNFTTKTKSEVAAASVAASDPVYLHISTDIANTVTAGDSEVAADKFIFTGGYSWDVPAHHEYNFAASKIMLWMPKTLTGDTSTIKFKVGTGAEQSLVIEYKYKEEGAPAGAVTINSATKGTNEAANEFYTACPYTVSYANSKVVVDFGDKTKSEVETASSDVVAHDPVYLHISTDIPNTVTAGNTTPEANKFIFTSGYGWDNAEHHEWNFENGTIKLWMPKTLGESNTSTIKFKVGTGEEQTLTIEYKYAAETPEVEKATVNFNVVNNSGKTFSSYYLFGTDSNGNWDTGVTAIPSTFALDIPVARLSNCKIILIAGADWSGNENQTVDIALSEILSGLEANGTRNVTITVDGTTVEEAGGDNGKYNATASISNAGDGDGDGEGEGGNPGTPNPGTTNPGTSTNRPSTSTSTPSTSKPTEVPAVDTKVEADVKVGEEVKAEAAGLGEVTVKTDAEDTALEGAKVEVAVTNKEADTSAKLNAAVGTSATEEVKKLVKAAVEAVKKGDAVTFDISFTKDGKEVQPGKAVTITAPVPAALKGADKLFVYHVTDKGFEKVDATYNKAKGTITITNDSFSPYIISKVEIKAAGGNTSSETNTSAPTSNGNPSTGIALAVAPIAIAGAAVAIVSGKKRK